MTSEVATYETKLCPILNGTPKENSAQVDHFLASSHCRDGLLPVDESAFHHLGVMKERYELHIVTARKEKYAETTRSWIQEHYPHIFTEIHFGNHYLTDEEISELK